MNGKKAKMIREYLKNPAFDHLKKGDIRTKANYGVFAKDDKGNDVFYPPQSVVYPQDHQRRVYKQLKDMYRNT